MQKTAHVISYAASGELKSTYRNILRFAMKVQRHFGSLFYLTGALSLRVTGQLDKKSKRFWIPKSAFTHRLFQRCSGQNTPDRNL